MLSIKNQLSISALHKRLQFRLREAQLQLRRSRNIIGRKPTSFEATPQHRSFVPQAAMMFSLRSKWCCPYGQMMLCLRHKWKIRELCSRIFGWGSRIRTYECQSQSLVPYRLAIPHWYYVFTSTLQLYHIIALLSSIFFCFLKKSFFKRRKRHLAFPPKETE